MNSALRMADNYQRIKSTKVGTELNKNDARL